NRRLPTGSGRKWARQASAQSSLASATTLGSPALGKPSAESPARYSRTLSSRARAKRVFGKKARSLGRRPGVSSSTTPSAPSSQTRFVKDRKSTRLNSSHVSISYAVFCLKKKKNNKQNQDNLNLKIEQLSVIRLRELKQA